MSENFNDMDHITIEKLEKMHIFFFQFPEIKSAQQGLVAHINIYDITYKGAFIWMKSFIRVLPIKLELACVKEIFMCWFETSWSSPCAQKQCKLKVNPHKSNIHMCDLSWYTDKAQPNTWKPHHVFNITTKVNFCLEHNISRTSKTHSDTSWTPICWVMLLTISQ